MATFAQLLVSALAGPGAADRLRARAGHYAWAGAWFAIALIFAAAAILLAGIALWLVLEFQLGPVGASLAAAAIFLACALAAVLIGKRQIARRPAPVPEPTGSPLEQVVAALVAGLVAGRKPPP